MKSTIRSATLCAAACLSQIFFATAGHAASTADWRHDVDAIVQDVVAVHPDAFTKIPRAEFLKEAKALDAALPRLTEEQRMVRAMQLVALIGDGHTWLEPHRPDFALWYPLRLYEFTDGYFVTAAYKSDADLVGAQLLEVAGRPVGGVMDTLRTVESSNNALDEKEHIFAFSDAELMKGLGFAAANGTLSSKFRLRDGTLVTRLLVPHRTDDERFPKDDSTLDWRFLSEVYGPPFGALADWTTAYKNLPTLAYRTSDNTRPPHFTFRRPFVARGMPDRDAYYIGVNSVGNWNDKTFDGFFRDALAEIDKQKPKSLIVDIRYNPGGDGSKVPAMIHEFIKREDNPPWKHIYILTGRKTFSAATMFLAAFVNNVPCSIVGEPAGAPLDAFGDPTTIDLDRAGLRLHVSTLWHQLEDQGARYPIMPVDVPAPFSSTDYAAGRDPAVDAILDGAEMRSIPLIALEDGGAVARKIFDDRKTRFVTYSNWMRTREIDLVNVYHKLNDAKRPADALEVAKIDVELYPQSARAWGFLGQAQIATGDKAAGLASYTRALALDPNNLDNLDERDAIAGKSDMNG
jgi:Peptidase family S41